MSILRSPSQLPASSSSSPSRTPRLFSQHVLFGGLSSKNNDLSSSSGSSGSLAGDVELKTIATFYPLNNPLVATVSRARVKSKVKRAKKKLIHVTHHSLVDRFFGDLQGCERLAFAFTTVAFISLCWAHFGVGLGRLTLHQNTISQVGEEHVDSDFWKHVGNQDLWFAASACTPHITTISHFSCVSFSVETDPQPPRYYPSVCRNLTVPEGSVFGGGKKDPQPFTCCACFYPKTVYDDLDQCKFV